MTKHTPEPNTPADRPTEVDAPDQAHVPAPVGEQGDGDLEPGDDSGNPHAGVDVADIEANQAEPEGDPS